MTSKEQRRARLRAGLRELKYPELPQISSQQILGTLVRFSLNMLASIGIGALAISQAISPSSYNITASVIVVTIATAIQMFNLRRGRVSGRTALLVPALYALILFGASSNHGLSAVVALAALILSTFENPRSQRLSTTLPVAILACGQTLQLSETLLALPLLLLLPFATLFRTLPAQAQRYREAATAGLALLSLLLQLI